MSSAGSDTGKAGGIQKAEKKKESGAGGEPFPAGAQEEHREEPARPRFLYCVFLFLLCVDDADVRKYHKG